MHAKFSFRKVAEMGIFLFGFTTLTLVGCGGEGTGNTAATQTYTASAGVGEVLQFIINKTNLRYSYTVVKTSYASAGVTEGQTGTGSLTDSGSGNGSYTLGASSDSFIQGGKLLPVNDGMLAGHVQIPSIDATSHIPVLGISSPITQLASLEGTYNFQGFACNALGIADVSANPNCSTNYGTIDIDAVGNLTKCNEGSSSIVPCVSIESRTLQVIGATPGVFDYRDGITGHAGWFFAFTAANGQKVAILDNDDAATPRYGQAVLSTYASATSGEVSGTYFKNDNQSSEVILTINDTTYSNDLGFTGTIAYNTPWNGLSTFSVTDGVTTVEGMGMISGTGVYTHLIDGNVQFFASGVKY